MKSVKIIGLSIVLSVLLLPTVSFAGLFEFKVGGSILSCTGNYSASSTASSTKMCDSVCDILSTINNIVNMASTYTLILVLPAVVLWGAYEIVTAGANPSGVESGKKRITAAVVGLAIMLCSVVLIKTFTWAIGIGAGGGNASSSAMVAKWPDVICDPSKVPGGVLDTDALRREVPLPKSPSSTPK